MEDLRLYLDEDSMDRRLVRAPTVVECRLLRTRGMDVETALGAKARAEGYAACSTSTRGVPWTRI
jgi:hypothetical protein